MESKYAFPKLPSRSQQQQQPQKQQQQPSSACCLLPPVYTRAQLADQQREEISISNAKQQSKKRANANPMPPPIWWKMPESKLEAIPDSWGMVMKVHENVLCIRV